MKELTQKEKNAANNHLTKYYLYFPILNDPPNGYPQKGYKSLMADFGFDEDGYYVKYKYRDGCESHTFDEKKDSPNLIKDVFKEQNGDIQKDKLTQKPMERIRDLYFGENGDEIRRRINDHWRDHAKELLYLLCENNVFSDEETEKDAYEKSKGLNDDPLRFLAELIQNADDCDYKGNESNRLVIEFDMNKKEITLFYPEKGFSFSDIISLSGINDSGKKWTFENAISTIGEKGRGFKTLFKYFDKIHINSGGYTFYYNLEDANFRQPLFDDAKAIESGTMIRLIPNQNTKDNFGNFTNDIKTYCGYCESEDLQYHLFTNNPVYFTKQISELLLLFHKENRKQDRLLIINTHTLNEEMLKPGSGSVWWENGNNTETVDSVECTGSMEIKYWEDLPDEDVDNKDIDPKRKAFINLQGIVMYPDYSEHKGLICGLEQLKGFFDIERAPGNAECSLVSQKRPLIMFGIKDEITEEQHKEDFGGHIYTFLPTSMNMSIPFIMQIPFELTDNRACAKLDSTGWNGFMWERILSLEDGLIKKWYDLYGKGNPSYLPFAQKTKENNLLSYPKEVYCLNAENNVIREAKNVISELNNEYEKDFKDLYKGLEVIPVWSEGSNEEYKNIKEVCVPREALVDFDQKTGENTTPWNPILNVYLNKENKYRFRCIDTYSTERIRGFARFLGLFCDVTLNDICEKIKYDQVRDSISDELEKENNDKVDRWKSFTECYLKKETWGTIWDGKNNKKWIYNVANGNLYLKINFVDEDEYVWYSNDDLYLFVEDSIKLKSIGELKDIITEEKTGSIYILGYDKNSISEDLCRLSNGFEAKLSGENTEECIFELFIRIKDNKLTENLKWALFKECYLQLNKSDKGKAESLFETWCTTIHANEKTKYLWKVVCGRNNAKEEPVWQECCYDIWKYLEDKSNDENSNEEFYIRLNGMSDSLLSKINPKLSDSKIAQANEHILLDDSKIEKLIPFGEYPQAEEIEVSLGDLEDLKRKYPDWYLWENMPFKERSFILFSGMLILKNREEALKAALENGKILPTQFIFKVERLEKDIIEPDGKYNPPGNNDKEKIIRIVQASQINRMSYLDSKTSNNEIEQTDNREDNPYHELLQNFHDQMDSEKDSRNPIVIYKKWNRGRGCIACAYRESEQEKNKEGKYVERVEGRGFSAKDILSLVTKRLTGKTEIADATGYKGIGFLSLTDVSDYITVFSNGYDFAFDCKRIVDTKNFREKLNEEKYFDSDIISYENTEIIWDECSDERDHGKRFDQIPLIRKSDSLRFEELAGIDLKSVREEIFEKYNQYCEGKVEENELTEFIFAIDEIPDAFADMDMKDSLFMHRCNKIVSIEDNNEDHKVLEIPPYPNKSVFNGDEFSEIKLDEWKIEDNKQNEDAGITYWGVYVENEDDSKYNYEVLFIVEEKMDTDNSENGHFYVTFPLKTKTGGAVHINVPALKTDNGRSVISKERSDTEIDNYDIMEAVAETFARVFNAFAQKMLEKEIPQGLFRYVPVDLYNDWYDREGILDLKLFYCITCDGPQMMSWNEIENKNAYVMEEYMEAWFEKWDGKYEFFHSKYKGDGDVILVLDKAFTFEDIEGNKVTKSTEDWLDDKFIDNKKLNHADEPGWFLDYVRDYIGKKELSKAPEFKRWFEDWKRDYYSSQYGDICAKIGGKLSDSYSNYSWDYCLYRMFSYDLGADADSLDFYFFEGTDILKGLKDDYRDRLKVKEKEDSYWSAIAEKYIDEWANCYEDDRNFKTTYELIKEYGASDECIENINKHISGTIFCFDKINNDYLATKFIYSVKDEDTIIEDFDRSENKHDYIELPAAFYSRETGEPGDGVKFWIRELEKSSYRIVSPVCLGLYNDITDIDIISALLSTKMGLRDIADPLFDLGYDEAEKYWNKLIDNIEHIINNIEETMKKGRASAIERFYGGFIEWINEKEKETAERIELDVQIRLLNYIIESCRKRTDISEDIEDDRYIPVFMWIMDDVKDKERLDKDVKYLGIWYEDFLKIITDKEFMQVSYDNDKTPQHWKSKKSKEWVDYFKSNHVHLRVILKHDPKGYKRPKGCLWMQEAPKPYITEDELNKVDEDNKENVKSIIKWSIIVNDKQEYGDDFPNGCILRCYPCGDRKFEDIYEVPDDNRYKDYYGAHILFGADIEIRQLLMALISDAGFKIEAKSYKPIIDKDVDFGEELNEDRYRILCEDIYERINKELENKASNIDDIIFDMLACSYRLTDSNGEPFGIRGYGTTCPVTKAQPFLEKEVFSVFWYDIFGMNKSGIDIQVPLYGINNLKETFTGYVEDIETDILDETNNVWWKTGKSLEELRKAFLDNKRKIIKMTLTMIPSSSEEKTTKTRQWKLTLVHQAVLLYFIEKKLDKHCEKNED